MAHEVGVVARDVLTQRPFPNVSELQARVDGVDATRWHRDAVVMAVRASTRLTREPRRCRDGINQRRLQNADILLMDEPTNHLDVMNVKWVKDYIKSLTNVTCIMVGDSASVSLNFRT